MSPVNYARTLLKISVSQMLQTVGFQTAQSTALDILVEILERYIYLLSKTSHEYSEFGKLIYSFIYFFRIKLAKSEQLFFSEFTLIYKKYFKSNLNILFLVLKYQKIKVS